MFEREHYRANGDAPKVKSGEKDVKLPFYVLWRWENNRGESVSIEGRSGMSESGNFGEYAVCFAGIEIARESARTSAEEVASEIRNDLPLGRFESLDFNEKRRVVKYLVDSTAEMSESELNEAYESADMSKLGDYE